MIYLIIFLFILFLSIVYDFGGLKLGKYANYMLVLIMLVCLSGFRYKVGGDTYRYMGMHDIFIPSLSDFFAGNTKNVFNKLQPLWILISSIARSIHKDFFVVQFIHAIILNSTIFYFFYKNTKYIFTGILFYFMVFYFNFNFEILRESLAVSFFLFAIPSYKKSKWLKYYLISTLGVLVHFSATILLILPLFKNYKFKLYQILLIFIAGLVANKLLVKIFDSIIGNSGFLESIKMHVENKYTFFGILSILATYIIFPYLILIICKFFLKIKSDNYKFLELYILIGATVSYYFIFWRFLSYLTPILFLFITEFLHGIARKRDLIANRIIIIPAVFFIVSFFYCHPFFKETSKIVPSSHFYDRWYPYYSIFDKKTHKIRDKIVELEFKK
jgi:hypothetical protein